MTERLKNCVMSKKEVEAILKPEIADLAKQLTKELTPIIYKECRHQVCEEIREKAKQDAHRGLYTITYADLYNIEKGGDE